MADAIVSAVAEQIVGLIAEQARFHFNLVRGAEEEVRQLSDELTTIRYVLDDAENRRFKDKTVNYWLSRLEHTSREMEDVLDEWNYAILKLEMEQRQSDDAVVADPPPSKQKPVCSFIPSSSCFSFKKVVVADPPPPKQKPVCSFIPSSSCFSFKKVVVRHDIANKILNVKAKLDQVLKEKDKYNFVSSQPSAETSHKSWRDSTSFTNLVEVQGRDSDRDILVTKLLGKHEELGSIQVVSIVGVGGLGKTTLAQLVYGDSRVDKFFDLRIWVCVSDPFDLAAIAKGIIESVSKGDSPNTNNLETLLQSVSTSITGKTFFLVLDDVWTEDYEKWDKLKSSLKCGGMGSKILVTTRNEKVAKITGTVDNDIHYPGKLSHEDSWLLLRHIANQPGMEFEEIGKKIARKCDGLPLAVKTLGSVLRFKNIVEKWENVLESEVWQLEEAKTDLFPHLLLSYNELSPTLKRCFSYCAVFPKNFEINVKSLIGYWMALGYLGSDIGNMELKGQECFDILAMCSLFQDFKNKKNDWDEKIKTCKMHDIVHDFAQFLRKSGKVEATGMNKTSCQACDPLLVSTVNEFCTLFVCGEESPQNLCGCLKCLRVLSMSYCISIPRGIENMIHLRHLDLHGNSYLELPKEIGNLIQLRHLNLSWNSFLKELPREIGNLIELRHLDLICNKSLEELPREIGNLIELRHLELIRNESLKELPREIGNLIELRHLKLSWNKSLKELPREIGNLIQLKHLHLGWNESLKELPREIGNLIELRHLDLSGNKSLKELPREIGNLIELRHLKLSWNESLKELPREIGNLIELRHLKLSWNKSLKELPREIGNLIELRHLDLSGNKSLKELPREIGNLIQLRHLDLRSNSHLEELPESISSLQELQTLDVLHCWSLRKIPEGVGQLTGLHTLGEFYGGNGGNKLGLLNKLNNLRGRLELTIGLANYNLEQVVEDAREAEL